MQQPKDGATEPLYRTYGNHKIVYGYLASSFVVSTRGFDPDPLSRGAAGGVHTLFGINITTTKKVCGQTDWNIAIAHVPDAPVCAWDTSADLAFIKDNEIRIVLGPHDPHYMAILRNLAGYEGFLYYSFKTPLSESESVFVEAIGPFRDFTAPLQDGFVVPQPKLQPAVVSPPTAKWPPIEHLGVKQKGGPNSMQKLLVFVGARQHFRSQTKRTERQLKAINKGLLRGHPRCRGATPVVAGPG